MSAQLAAVLGALAAVLTACGGFLAVLYGRRKTAADTEAVRLANLGFPAAELRANYAVVTQRLTQVEAQLATVWRSYSVTQSDLDQARDEIGMLRQENRAWSEYYVTAANRMRSAGVDVPEPPSPRTEFTRRTDFPDRIEQRRRGEPGE